MTLLAELRRRRVPQVLAIYMAGSFAIAQAVDLLIEALNLPDLILSVFVFAALGLFPAVAVFAWVYDLTPQGVVRTLPAADRAAFRWTVPRATTAVVVLTGLIVAGWIVLHPSPADPGRVVVLPLENRTGEPALDPLGEVAANWMIEILTRTGFVEVVDERSTFAAAAVGGRAAATEMRAGTIVSGAYYREGDSLLFQVRITRSDGSVLEALPAVRGPAASAEATRGLRLLSDRVLAALATHYDSRLANFEVGGTPPSYDAYQSYVDGLHTYLQGDYAGAAKRFNAAAAKDTTFLRAILWNAVSHRFAGNPRADSVWGYLLARQSGLSEYDRHHARFFDAYFRADLEEAYREAQAMVKSSPGSDDAVRELALSALRTWRMREGLRLLESLDPVNSLIREWPEYWFLRAFAHEQLGDLKAALRVAREGRRRSPGPRTFLAEAMILADLGRADESVRLMESVPAGIALGADQAVGSILVALRLRQNGHPDHAASLMRQAAEHSRQISAPHRRAANLYLAGEYEASRLVLDSIPSDQVQSLPSEQHAVALGMRGALAARRGDTAAAREALTALEALPDTRADEYARARIHALLGERDAAVRLLGTIAYDTKFNIPSRLHPDLASLRGYPPFEQLMQPRR